MRLCRLILPLSTSFPIHAAIRVMKACVVLIGLIGLVDLDGPASGGIAISPSMSWSPDSQWVSYTVITEAQRHGPRASWLFDTVTGRRGEPFQSELGAQPALSARAAYRIWTTSRDGQSTVLIDESRWPLSTPSWGIEGRTIAYCRFVVRSIDPGSSLPRGQLEVVVQDSLDRKRVIWSKDLELDPQTTAALPHVRPSWCSDGSALAIPVPGPEPCVTVVQIAGPKVLLTLPMASCPSWSPDGMRLAFIRKTGRIGRVVVIERKGEGFAAPRDLGPTGPLTASPGWGAESRSILVVSDKPPGRSYEVDLVRRYLDGPGEMKGALRDGSYQSARTVILVPSDAVHRGVVVRGITIDFDRDGEHCVFSVDYQGRDSAMVTALPGERQILRPFNPVDVSQRIGAVSISPDGQTVAARFGPLDRLTPPAICDWTSEQPTTLLVPDRAAKRMWSDLLSAVARGLLATGLPKLAVDGQFVERPTLLPIPGELSLENPISARVGRVARLGATLDARDDDDADPSADSASKTAELETRLFFRYLAGDCSGALATLDTLESRIMTPTHRLAALSVKAQILWALGERTRAQSIIDYLQAALGTESKRVEETPLGLVITKELTPTQAWARHLAKEAAKPEAPKHPDEPAQHAELPDEPFHNGLIPAPPQAIERREGDAPAVPGFRRFDGLDR
jgi:Tol biopolymer transport system component